MAARSKFVTLGISNSGHGVVGGSCNPPPVNFRSQLIPGMKDELRTMKTTPGLIFHISPFIFSPAAAPGLSLMHQRRVEDQLLLLTQLPVDRRDDEVVEVAAVGAGRLVNREGAVRHAVDIQARSSRRRIGWRQDDDRVHCAERVVHCTICCGRGDIAAR